MEANRLAASAINWNKAVHGYEQNISQQLAIVEAERQEVQAVMLDSSKTSDDLFFELADLIWTAAWLGVLAKKQGFPTIEAEAARYMVMAGKALLMEGKPYGDHLQAVADSNWSKIRHGAVLPMDHLDPKRFKNIHIKGKYISGLSRCWLVGDDHQYPEAVQRDKVLKPRDYITKAEALERILKRKKK